MEAWLQQISTAAPLMPYVVMVGILLLTGFGLPLPEDIPLIVAGWLAGEGYAEPWIMFPAVFLAIVGSDVIVFALGRRYGHHVQKLPLIRRFLTPERIAKCETMLEVHGGKYIFTARFLPSLRTAAMFSAGALRVPYWKFVLFDGAAAMVSVPLILILAYIFSDSLTRVKDWIAEGQIVVLVVVVVAIAIFITIKLLTKRKMASA